MHFFVVKLKTLKFLTLMFLVLAVLSFDWGGKDALAAVYFNKTTRRVPIYCVETPDKKIAITFDAAWGADKTQKILDILKENEVDATFFLVGVWADKHPELVKSISEQGLEIGTHSNLHPDMTKISDAQVVLEFENSIRKLEGLTGKDVKVFRVPYGAYNNYVLDTAESFGLQTVQWNVDSLDWKGISAQEISANILTKVDNGSIILCHNNADNILEALPTVISALKARGFKFVKVSDLIYQDNFTIDQAGKQIKNQ